MTTLTEAARMALDALEYHTAQTRPIERTNQAITALRAALSAPADVPALPPLPDPYDYCYEWDGPYGTRKFSAAAHNGNRPNRAVMLFNDEQMRAFYAQGYAAGAACRAAVDVSTESTHAADVSKSGAETNTSAGDVQPVAAIALGALIAAGFVSREKADEAARIMAPFATPAAAPAAPAPPATVPAEPLNGIRRTMFHDEGAIAQCGHCKRYTLDRNALNPSDRKQPVCDCGRRHYWSGSFKKPGPDAQWFGKPPAAAAPAAPVPAPVLTDAELLRIARDVAPGNEVRLARDVGPYEVTEPTPMLRALAGAILAAAGIGTAPTGRTVQKLTDARIDTLAEKQGDYDTTSQCWSFNGDRDFSHHIYNFTDAIQQECAATWGLTLAPTEGDAE